ncbi:hypothetical protein ACGFXC_10500 [Streptomyces sp. NPDC048507]|uniref:hypothetical protein n=1 Tax=Streptomyces sp. NPDC048507 TaxID=3365560 RepID=UPI003722A2F9
MNWTVYLEDSVKALIAFDPEGTMVLMEIGALAETGPVGAVDPVNPNLVLEPIMGRTATLDVDWDAKMILVTAIS